jgi:hypothetical protein
VAVSIERGLVVKIMVDLEPKDVWRIQAKAEQLGIPPGAVLRDELAQRTAGDELRSTVRELVQAGWCDADIAARLGTTNASIKDARRRLQLPANKRRWAA